MRLLCNVITTCLVAWGLAWTHTAYAGEALKDAERKAREKADGESVKAGRVQGLPCLGNEFVNFVWARPKDGAGLSGILDKVAGRQLLRGSGRKAPMWRIDVKRGDKKEKATYDNVGTPCEVGLQEAGREGIVTFKWDGEIAVEVEVRLADDESQARARIKVRTKRDDEGLLTVTFPVVEGIMPLSKGGKSDAILTPAQLGVLKPSPLVSGKNVDIPYPIAAGLQMTALLGEGTGLYFAEEDGDANQKEFSWKKAETNTLTFDVSHPVLDWGADEPVRSYESPGDIVMGPFQGDWFDAARIYRKWALSAPWSAKGPIHQRPDYPQWLIRVAFWANDNLSGEEGIEQALVKREFFGLPESVCHDYRYMFAGYYHHNRNPEYLPPRIGSENYKRVVRDFHKRGIRIVPYVIGWLWNMSTESYRTEDAEHKGAMCGPDGNVYWTWAGGIDPQAAMCPATEIWRNKLLELSKTLLGEYGVDGMYYDYFTVHCADCFVKSHGHPIGGGNYWTKSVHDLYERIREECRQINPEAMFCGEENAEWVIDVLDTAYAAGPHCTAPVFMAVYHGYTQTFGGLYNQYTPPYIGRMWLLGCQMGPTNQEYPLATRTDANYDKLGPWYRNLLKCRWEFAWPYLGAGEMLRPPKIEGDIPSVTNKVGDNVFTLPAVDATAWLAPDGSVGIFFLNYDGEKAYEFTWTEDLSEFAGITADKKLRVTRWTPEGEEDLGEWRGGLVTQTMEIAPWGMIALKLEVVR